ncbi:putative lipid phosphate phosphatase 3, chloroplastic [Mycena venus]|uniref:Putative lipid phosphate phosphatase 3, chloroplastic n=1 Tax=Mycena venus TaxID=2733690 RepID=A0A8H7CI39_9AGAR|nr:putative lipid phosphate phosphatase 3, chloroplastic [Mycena venus]
MAFHHNANAKRTQPGAAAPFRFGTWIRLHGIDLVTMALMGALGLGIYEAPPAPNRSFPLYFQNGQVVYPEFAYPIRKEIVPIFAAALIAFFVPFFFIALFQARRRSLDDLCTTTLGLLKSLITAAVFQVWLKWLIGGLRPHFYAACQPSIQPGDAPSGIGFAALMYDRSVCTGDKNTIDDSLESFPSGHSTAAWAGLGYLALYLNAQLKVMSAHNPAYWKMILMFAPLLGATLISGALTIDEFHNWYRYPLFDFRFNHILLPRTTSLLHRQPFFATADSGPFFDYAPRPEYTTTQMPFTREGGWGWGQEACVGAPGDATVLGVGSGMGGGLTSGMSARHHGMGTANGGAAGNGVVGANHGVVGGNGVGTNHGVVGPNHGAAVPPNDSMV